MRAVLAHGAGDFRLEEVPEPVLDGGAVVKFLAGCSGRLQDAWLLLVAELWSRHWLEGEPLPPPT